MNAKAPQFLTDVYRDLRDRHLLIPAVALLIALIAVPVLLRKPADPVPPPPVATAPTGDASAVTSAVLVDDSVDVRDYRKRLAKLKSKNPFEQRFGVDQSGSGDGSGGDEATTTDTGTELPAATGDAGTATAPTDTSTSTDVSSGSPIDTSTTPTDSTDTTDTDTETTKPEIRFLAGRVDITMGPLGKAREYDNVKYLTFLPDDADSDRDVRRPHRKRGGRGGCLRDLEPRRDRRWRWILLTPQACPVPVPDPQGWRAAPPQVRRQDLSPQGARYATRRGQGPARTELRG